MSIIKMTSLNLKDKRVLIRVDFNVPIKNGKITSDARIKASLFTIEHALKSGARIMLMSHLGRPQEGSVDEQFSLKPIAAQLEKLLKHPVRFVDQWIDGVSVEKNEVVLLENVRFEKGEKSNDETLSKKMAALCDVFVMDAFGSAHRAHASTYGVAEYAPIACAGPLLTAELEALSQALENPSRPLVSIVGGSKTSTKVGVLKSVIDLSDYLIVGGGIANTFLKAAGFPIGKSLHEPELIEKAKTLIQIAEKRNMQIPLPTDVIVATELTDDAKAFAKPVTEVQDNEMILDIGPDSQKCLHDIIKKAATIVWNGPVGVFEIDQFAEGTKALAQSIAESSAFSIAGGGDTLAAIEKFNIADEISYISTGGGAFLEFLERKKLPAVAILERRALLNGYS